MAIDLAPAPVIDGSLPIQERTFELKISTPNGGTPTISLGREQATTINQLPVSLKRFGYLFQMDSAHQAVAFNIPNEIAQAAGLTQTAFTLGQMAMIVSAACDAAATNEAAIRANAKP